MPWGVFGKTRRLDEEREVLRALLKELLLRCRRLGLNGLPLPFPFPDSRELIDGDLERDADWCEVDLPRLPDRELLKDGALEVFDNERERDRECFDDERECDRDLDLEDDCDRDREECLEVDL